ncbi:hybrid sensor histidine kinase/response regulator [Umezakia ovalisporum]|jgi:PAS domain S-box-containing protein|uniref:hybrid sensor histidine kinase/response regulator n=1 Tax=Umezakia ovalisporum TaxID=75695 RepID=UPI0006F002E7|nr:PAS domain-containing protein [Umezakia ovalisporum]MBI1241517.1 PAS domain-containing protein [Nostoc sp. RI_552]MDH6083657.1 PAS domain-containing protein [Umezakia ovalisporum TAC611]MDH6088999.1 PAS domain-containing protein [Umezakia ovalisporum Ak1311]CEJ44316.1 Multi-sensor signal transduction histidine kinase [Umezakia ovalisporum]
MTQPLTILIVDDCAEDRQAYCRYLLQDQEYNYSILEEESGEGGLILYQQFHPDVILLDFLLPDLDGLEFLAELKQQSPQIIPPVIMLTGYGNEAVAVQAMKSGVQDYLVKGQTSGEHLRSTIHSVIKNAQLSQELQRSEERFRTSVENLLDCFGIFSAARDETGKILHFLVDYLNPAAYEFSQISSKPQGEDISQFLLNIPEYGLFDECCKVVETGRPLVKESLVYTAFNQQQQSAKVIDIRITKMGDGFVAAWRDVTEKKQAEEKLQKSQQFIEGITDTIPGVLYVYDLIARRNVYTNSQVSKLLGYTCSQIQNMGTEFISSLIHPEDQVGLAGHWQLINSCEDGDILDFEYRIKHANGEWLWFCSRDTVFNRNVEGTPRQIVGTAFDITERKRVEEQLRLSNERFQLAAAAVNCLIYDRDIKNSTVNMTEGLTRILGYSLEEVDPSHEWWIEKIHPEDRQRLYQQFLDVFKTQKYYSFEYRMRHKDQQYRYVLDQGIIIRDTNGQVVRTVGSTTDISQRKLVEIALRESKEQYRYLSDSIPQLVWMCNSQGECEYVNEKWYELTGETIASAQGFGWTKVIHPDDVSSVMQQWTQALETGRGYEQEIRYQKRDGSYCWHLVRSVPIKNDQGEIVKWFGTSTDIDQRKQLEAERNRLLQMEQAARNAAEKANQTKDEFVAMVSHDLRSPLNAILGWAKLLRTRQLPANTVNNALETIERNAQSQAKLLEDLLNMSRILRGQLQLEVAPVQLVNIVKASMETAYPPANAKGIHLESIIDESIPLILGDANRLLQILNNLLSNAIKFTPPGGRVEVRLGKSDESSIVLQVSDTGVGIQAEFLPYVFERYRQANFACKENGLGLGLAIARHLVELHKGTIEAHSKGEGLGASFTIKLPSQTAIINY